ncbi:hypothetical protein Poli38472_011265 [Pythium oligandrum]|uniref:PARP-type domain-containing protein n=1 Tax=Pythium oligandrum TaxID=41045 RepID=A0A8K1CQG4_PYTOL|nr:hypothetical protein Poli38472_011265 [Pythium oligandrum]|eukprot:TMW67645.1 hypothetical protein Poli38472_011265 [Pythium oligandrum]
MAPLNTSSPTNADCIESPWTRDGTYIIECTRRAHACCRSCDSTIEVDRLRMGVVYQHKNGFVCINWHHLECYPIVQSIPLCNLEGYTELDASSQQLVRHCLLSPEVEDARFRQTPSACTA